MKLLPAAVVFAAVVFFLLPVVVQADHLTDWSYIQTETKEYKSLQKSLNLESPENTLITPDTLRELSRDAGNSDDHPGAMGIELFSFDSTAFDAVGNYHLIQQQAVKILNSRGVKKYGTVRLGYSLPYDRTRVLDAYIIQPDGSTRRLTQEDIQDVSNSDDMDANIYEPIWRAIILSFPGVASGSTVYWAYEHADIKPRTPNSFQWGHTFRSTLPVLHARLRLCGPEDVKIHWYLANNEDGLVSFSEKSSSGRTCYTWESGAATMIKEEPGMIPVDEVMTSLIVTTDTWAEMAGRELPYIEENLVPDDAIKTAVADLTADAVTWEEKMQRLFWYVTRRVRYMGVAYGDRPGINPDPVARTFKNNAGVCKDKAGLLTAMLRIAGIEACYTLNNPVQRIFTQVAVDQFNHAIVSARLPGESQWRYLDVTSDLSRAMCPASSGGTQVLRITSENAGIETIPVFPPEQNSGKFDVKSSIDGSGRLKCHVTYTGEGAADQYYRGQFYYTDQTQWGDFFSYMVTYVSPSAELMNWSISPEKMDDLSSPFSFTLDFEVPDYAVFSDNLLLFRSPMTDSPFDWFQHKVSEISDLSRREYTADLAVTSYMVTREEISIPDGFSIYALPDRFSLNSDELKIMRNWQTDSGVIKMTQEITVKKPRIDPDHYQEFRNACSRIEKSNGAWLILEGSR